MNYLEKQYLHHAPPDQAGATLIFPAVNQAARDYHCTANQHGERVLVAASEFDSDTADYFCGLIRLPFIYEDSFLEHLINLVNRYHITRIYCPIASVHGFIEDLIRHRKLELKLVSVSPIEQQVNEYNALIKTTSEMQLQVENIRKGLAIQHIDTHLSSYDIAAILRQANNIYGESNNEKISALMAIFSDIPEGDVVEIGSLLGKSAFVMLYLSRHFQVGNVLCVDPWSADDSEQKDSPGHIRTKLPAQWDYNIFPGALIVNMLPMGRGDFNYLHMTSEQAAKHYNTSFIANSEALGKVGYLGKISVLHIDGNHDYAAVKKDCDLWLRHLLDGGVVVLDDYKWAHGDGPCRVGNELLVMYQDKIKWAFVCGKALFIKFIRAPGLMTQ